MKRGNQQNNKFANRNKQSLKIKINRKKIHNNKIIFLQIKLRLKMQLFNRLLVNAKLKR